MNGELKQVAAQADIISGNMSDRSKSEHEKRGRSEKPKPKEKPKSESRPKPGRLTGDIHLRPANAGSQVERRVLSFKDEDVRKTAGMIVKIQNGEKVVVYKDEVDSLDKFLTSQAGDQRIPGKNNLAQRVVVAQEIFSAAEIVDIPQNPSLDEKVQVAEVQKAGESAEELLTIEEVSKRVKAQKTRSTKKTDTRGKDTNKQAEATDLDKALVLKDGDGKQRYIVSGWPFLENSSGFVVSKFLEDQGVPVQPDPEKWDKASLLERKRWLEDQGIFNVVELPEDLEVRTMGGGGTRYSDSGTKNIDELQLRLDELDAVESSMGATFDGNIDRQEIFELIKPLVEAEYKKIPAEDRFHEELKEVTIHYSLTQLKTLQSIERFMGDPDAFNGNYGQERSALYEKLADFSAAQLVIERLLYERGGYGPLSLSQSDEADSLQGSLDYFVELARTKASAQRDGFRFVDNFVKAIDTMTAVTNGDPAQAAIFESILPAAIRDELRTLKREMDRNFSRVSTAMGRENKNRLFEEVDNEAKSLENSYRLGSIKRDGYEYALFQFATKGLEARGKEGLKEWRASIIVEGFERKISSERDLGVPDDWRDSERNADFNYRFVESSDLSVNELGKALERVAAISENLSTVKGSDAVEAKRMKEAIDKTRLAVRAKYLQRKTMLESSCDPEHVAKVFDADEWTDETNRVYQGRFDVDHEGREFEGTDAAGHTFKFNIKDKGEQAMDAVLREENDKSKLIEGLTLMDLTKTYTVGSVELKQIEDLLRKRLTADEVATLNQLALDLKRIAIARAKIPVVTSLATIDSQVDAYWQVPGNAKGVIFEWLRKETLVGADGEYRDINRTTGEEESKMYLEERKEIVEERLAHKLRALGVPQEKIDEYKAVGLMSQVVNVAYYDKWMAGSFSEYGMVRVYDRNKPWFVQTNASIWNGQTGQYETAEATHYTPTEFAYTGHSNIYYQRMVDFGAEFLIDELRGRTGKGRNRETDSDFVFQKHMLGHRRGILSNNRLSVKLISDNLRGVDQFANSLLTEAGEARRQALGLPDFTAFVNDYIGRLDNIEKLNTQDGPDKDEFDYSWARGVALTEMLEDGLISFENINFSEVYRYNDVGVNVSKYNMIDWWGDRKAAKGYFGVKALQNYLKNPNTKTFFGVNTEEVFYSTRENRIKPWYKIIIPAHIELGSHWKEWWNMPYNMFHSEKDEVIEYAVETNRLERDAEERMKDELLKWGPLRGLWGVGPANVENIRALWESAKVAANETKKALPLIFFMLLFGLFKEMFSKSMPDLGKG